MLRVLQFNAEFYSEIVWAYLQLGMENKKGFAEAVKNAKYYLDLCDLHSLKVRTIIEIDE